MRSAFVIFLALTGAVQAQDLAQPRDGAPSLPLPGVECYCTDRSGSRVELGQTICLIVDGRAFLARCEMSLNVPMWRNTGDACVGAAVSGPGGGPGGRISVPAGT